MLTPEQPKVQPVNPFNHPFVRIVGERYVESVVYNKETGEAHRCWPIDGREMVASGFWSWEPVTLPEPAPEPAVEAAPVESEPAPTIQPNAEPKRGPGRPRKNP